MSLLPDLASSYRPGWTVGIPTYNRYAMIQQALHSVEAQRHRPVEIVISDNCSTDATPDIAAAKLSIPLRYFRQPSPVQPFANFIQVLSLCKTEYFSWLQDDDCLFSAFGDLALRALAAHADADAAIGYAFHSKDLSRLRSLETTVWGPPPFRMDFVGGQPLLVPTLCLIPWLTHFWPGFSPVAIFRTQALVNALADLPEFDSCGAYLCEQYVMSTINRHGPLLYLPSVVGVVRQHQSRVTGSQHFTQDAWAAAWHDLYSHLMAMMPSQDELVFRFFADHVANLDESELMAFRASLHRYDHPLAYRVLGWIDQIVGPAPLRQEVSVVVTGNPGGSGWRSLIKLFIPPLALSVLRRLRNLRDWGKT